MTAIETSAITVRTLGDTDDDAVRRLVDADPFVNVVVAERLESRIASRSERLGGELIGVDGPDGLIAACFSGGTVLPVGGDAELWRQVAGHLGERSRGCTSLVGRTDAIAAMWPVLAQYWGPVRLVRSAQPLLVLDHRPAVRPDPHVRPVRPDELDRYLPAAEAMFAEELGLAPFSGAARRSYRLRLAHLVAEKRVFIRLDRQGRVAFKAEIGAVSGATCQIQGVWVRPDLRGRGLGGGAVATVVEHALHIAPTVSLYVNDFNLVARRLYARLGMYQVATLSTVMF
jgi:predicted GNAT family acetyltransferase